MKNQNTIYIILGILGLGALIYFITKKPVENTEQGTDANQQGTNSNTNTGNVACSIDSSNAEENVMYNTLRPALVSYMDASENKPSTVSMSQSTRNYWQQQANQKGTTVRKISGKGLIFQWRGTGITDPKRNFVYISGVKKPVPDTVLDRLYIDLDTGCIV